MSSGQRRHCYLDKSYFLCMLHCFLIRICGGKDKHCWTEFLNPCNDFHMECKMSVFSAVQHAGLNSHSLFVFSIIPYLVEEIPKSLQFWMEKCKSYSLSQTDEHVSKLLHINPLSVFQNVAVPDPTFLKTICCHQFPNEIHKLHIFMHTSSL